MKREVHADQRKCAGKVKKVLHEFKAGTLKSSNGDKVTDRKQAIAIALSQCREGK